MKIHKHNKRCEPFLHLNKKLRGKCIENLKNLKPNRFKFGLNLYRCSNKISHIRNLELYYREKIVKLDNFSHKKWSFWAYLHLYLNVLVKLCIYSRFVIIKYRKKKLSWNWTLNPKDLRTIFLDSLNSNRLKIGLICTRLIQIRIVLS